MGIRLTIGILAAAFALLCTGQVSAQPLDGAFQLGLGTELFSYSNVTLENDDTGAETDVSTTQWGIHEDVALELGYGLSDALVLGAFIRLGGSSTTLEDVGEPEVETSDFTVFVGPKIDYMFGAGEEVRPFVGAVIGLTSTSQDSGAAETSLTGVELMGRVGLRWFAVPRFSIDPAVAFSWATASGEQEFGGATVDIGASGINLAILLGVSGWL